MTRISFVLASFNGAKFIEEQIDSILMSLGPDDEIVVSDDGSTDGTLDIVRSINDSRIHLISGGERLNYQGNFARAIAASRGQFIFFSDQDDICLPDRIPLSLAELAHASCVCGDAVVVDSILAPMQDSHFAARRAKFGAAWLFVRPAVIGATLACTREFLSAHLPFPKGVPHDMWLSIQAARTGKLAVVAQPLILYRRHQSAVSATGATSKRPIIGRLRERTLLLAAILRPPSKSGQDPLI